MSSWSPTGRRRHVFHLITQFVIVDANGRYSFARIKERPIVPSGGARRWQTEYVTVDFHERRANDEYESAPLPAQLLAYEISEAEYELQRYVRISTSKDN